MNFTTIKYYHDFLDYVSIRNKSEVSKCDIIIWSAYILHPVFCSTLYILFFLILAFTYLLVCIEVMFLVIKKDDVDNYIGFFFVTDPQVLSCKDLKY